MEQTMRIARRLMANPLFWIAVVLCSLSAFIGFFEWYARLGVDQARFF